MGMSSYHRSADDAAFSAVQLYVTYFFLIKKVKFSYCFNIVYYKVV